MKILVTGNQGQLGHDVILEAKKRSIDAVGVDVAEMDITNRSQVEQVISRGNYDAVVHCAAWTAVDKAEEPELFETVEAVNATGTGYIAKVCK
ncbi:MAG: sugar nucleotide-binding protein, partial [Allobaculum sp.]|nr:sugar nucleotide-binding protein [Allobaculum sp.]